MFLLSIYTNASISKVSKEEKIYEKKILQGDENGIKPNQKFERYRAYVMLNRLFGKESRLKSYKYSDSPMIKNNIVISKYVKKLISYLKAYPKIGITSEELEITNPYEIITQEEYAKILLIALRYYEGSNYKVGQAGVMATSLNILNPSEVYNELTVRDAAIITYNILREVPNCSAGFYNTLSEKYGHGI